MYTAKLSWITNPFTVKATGAVRGLDFAMEMGFTEIVVENDVLGILRKMPTIDTDLLPISNIVDEARTKLANFNICNRAHTKHSGNAAAHCLAKYGLRVQGDVK